MAALANGRYGTEYSVGALDRAAEDDVLLSRARRYAQLKRLEADAAVCSPSDRPLRRSEAMTEMPATRVLWPCRVSGPSS